MLKKIDGLCYVNLIHSGLKNLDIYRSTLNELNVFPVPDGDTGTNMVMTLRYGYDAVKSKTGPLSEMAKLHASAAVFGARGNSGVIVSQFFKGMAEVLGEVEFADCEILAAALQRGCDTAYASVAQPTEGTMLTVLKDSARALTDALPLDSIDSAIEVYLKSAHESLDRTPELLPILKKANVVDSGGCGIVYFFEGVKKYLNGEKIEADADASQEASVGDIIDPSLFSKDTVFEYGYCVEGMLQLKLDLSEFDHGAFKQGLNELGSSVVSSLEGDKVKLHVHVHDLGSLMLYCQKIGEFLTVKIENMTVQNIQKAAQQQKFLYNANREKSNFAVVATATNEYLQKLFFDMGADVVILSEIAPSSQDFLDAFKLTEAEEILVFPNSANSVMASQQAKELYGDAKVVTLDCHSASECYAALSIIDFDSGIDDAAQVCGDTISQIYQFSVYRATKDVDFDGQVIAQNEFFALCDKKILGVNSQLEQLILDTVERTLNDCEYYVITLFYGKDISEEYVEHLTDMLQDKGCDAEILAVPTYETLYDITVTFE